MDALNAVVGPLRPTIQTVTQALPAPVADFGVSLIGTTCYSSLVLNVDLSSANSECFSLAISKALGIAIVGGSSIIKVPQIIKLVNSQSAEGLSFLSYLLETASFIVTLAYNIRNDNPFSTFGEQAFIAVQNVAITILILVYSNQQPAAAAFVAGLSLAGYALLGPGELVSLDQMQYLQFISGFVGVASKLPQIYQNWQQGSTGVLSAYTVINFLFGSLARIFTTLKEVDDNLILGGFLAGAFFNLILFLQLVYYWNAPAPTSAAAAAASKKKAGKAKVEAAPVASAKATGASPRTSAPSTRRRG